MRLDTLIFTCETGDMKAITPYLIFGGRCQEAIDYYVQHLGAEVEFIMNFSDSPEPIAEGMLQPGFENKVMHATLRIGPGKVMVSDGGGEDFSFGGFNINVTPDSKAEADRMFAAMADGGSVMMPMSETFWSPWFGMVTDRFGVTWMFGTEPD
jgi:PhnB protein